VARIQIGGAGGAPSNNVIRSLRESGRDDHLIGQSSATPDLLLADCDEIHAIVPALAPEYPAALLGLLARTQPDLLHAQNDFEVRAVSRLRDEIAALGVRMMLPAPETVEICVDKFRSYEIWAAAGIPVPQTHLIRTPEDLDVALEQLGPTIWLRATEGGGGRGALPTDSRALAHAWIDHQAGWGRFTAARMLTPDSIAWQSIWYEGELVVAQTRRRLGWAFADRAPAGVTGVTHVGETVADAAIDDVAERAIRAVDPSPHGLFGVDMTLDQAGAPMLTEINIGRFFTTIYFFTKAGLNMPAIYRDLALAGRHPKLARVRNPLPAGLIWVRGMDVEPRLVTRGQLDGAGRDGLPNVPSTTPRRGAP
jgi:hypothetical protein